MEFAPDVLDGFSRASLPVPQGGSATLIRPDAAPADPRAAVLHVHGYNDYFYQAELSQWFTDAGFAFYAVDMRRAGRSLVEGDRPHDMADLAEQGDDIAAATAAIGELHPGLPIIVHAHSTGALAAPLWAKDRPHPALVALILNSPLLGLSMSRQDRAALKALPLLAKVRPGMTVTHRPAIYAKHLHVNGGGPASFDVAWKTPAGLPTTARWVYAVTRGWKRIDAGLGLEIPTLVIRSDSCGPETDDNPLIMEQDVVVDTDAAARRTPLIGPGARALVVSGGIHDLTQSAERPRAAYFDGVSQFLHEVLA